MDILKIIEKLKIDKSGADIFYNKFAKFNPILNDEVNGKLIVITSLNPTPAGEGKTTLLIGLTDAFNHENLSAIGTLREPSLGPVFGMKGGASGGGNSTLKHGIEIDLHFTNDFHSISTANNLISSVIENEIYFNSDLNIDHNNILWKRCIDLNERGLRQIEVKINNEKKYTTGFNITAASDLMALWCLVDNQFDFIEELDNTIVAFNLNGAPIRIRDLELSSAIVKILENVFKPNLALTSNNSPMIIHGGPFANIAHGCNTVIATKTALNIADYVFTECGFGSDLGLEKFMNIKMQRTGLYPSLIIICVTIKAMKYHGSMEDSIKSLKAGFLNLKAHINHSEKYNITPLIILNLNKQDTEEEVELFKKMMQSNNLNYEISNIYNEGPANSSKIVNKIIDSLQNPEKKFLYESKDSLKEKIYKICKNSYGIENIIFNDGCDSILEDKSLQEYFICMAKTQYSLSSDEKVLNLPENGIIEIKSIEINHAAKFIIPICGTIWKMPGLSKKPRAKNF
ncbi:MAG: formate--tetrahydrofolate ligase [Mycoplasma sp.]